MACNSPLTAWSTGDGVTFDRRHRDIRKELLLPCGRCQACRLERSKQWAIRCMHEAQMHEHNAYITLTYDEKNLPENNSLTYRDFQLFMKRLRKARSRNATAFLHAPSGHLLSKREIGFYMCGEYGEKFDRPHFHAILFGIDFADKKLFSTRQNFRLYTSETLTKIWQKGHATTGAVTYQSAAYVARYVMKKITGKNAKLHYQKINNETGEIYNKTPEFNNMSRRPGIGSNWLNQYTSDVYPDGKTILNGVKINAPRYYDKIRQRTHPQEIEDLQWKRTEQGIARAEDNTDARRAVKEKVLHAKLNQLKRTID